MYIKNKGFTLIEMMIVISIIGLLLSIVIPDLIKSRDKAKIQTCKASLEGLQKTLELYRLDHKGYPKDLSVLIKEEYIAEKTLKDPWLNEYYYVPITQKVKKEVYYVNYVLLSKGPDGKEGTEDDILAPRDSKKHSLEVLKGEEKVKGPILEVTPEKKIPKVIISKPVTRDKDIKK